MINSTTDQPVFVHYYQIAVTHGDQGMVAAKVEIIAEDYHDERFILHSIAEETFSYHHERIAQAIKYCERDLIEAFKRSIGAQSNHYAVANRRVIYQARTIQLDNEERKRRIKDMPAQTVGEHVRVNPGELLSSLIELTPMYSHLVIVIKPRVIHHEGDARSQSNPGHGYPAYDETLPWTTLYGCTSREEARYCADYLASQGALYSDIMTIEIGRTIHYQAKQLIEELDHVRSDTAMV